MLIIPSTRKRKSNVSYKVSKIYASLLLALFMSSTLLAETLHDYDIPAQSLNNGLVQFAAEADLNLIFPVDKIRGLNCKALKGRMTVQQGLSNLLQSSGYQYHFIDQNTVTLVPHADSKTSPSVVKDSLASSNQKNSIKVLQPLTVMGQLSADNRRQRLSRPYRTLETTSATRTATAIKSVPQSIQVVTRSLIDDQGNLGVSDALKNISGVTVGHTQLTPSFDFTQIRGFRAEQLLDGFTQYYNAGDRESLANIERIEVLKGSNALLYSGGSGSPAGGLVNIVSKAPIERSMIEAGIKYGSYQYYQPYFDLNQPINDQILFRVTGEYTYSESYLDVIETERFNINPALTITNNDNTSFKLQGKISSWEQVDYQGLPAQGSVTGDFSIHPETYIGPEDIEPSYAKFYGIWGAFDHAFNDHLSLTLKARYAESKFDQKIQTIFGADGIQADQAFSNPSTWALFNTELYQQQQELSFVGSILAKFSLGPVDNKLLMGADYSQYEDEGFIESASVGAVDLNKISFNSPYRKPGAGINNIFVVNTTYGGYLQLQSTFYDRLHLLTGVRLGYVNIDYKNESPGFKTTAQTQETKILPRIGATFDLTNSVSGFVSYSEGMRGQPFVNFVASPEAETSQQLEAGIKFDFSMGLNGQMAVYQIDRGNVAITDNTDPLRRSKTTGEQRSQGVEADLNWQLNKNINLLGSYAYTDALYIQHILTTDKGNPIPHIPKHSGRIWANYQFDQPLFNGLGVGAGIYAQSGGYLENSQFNKSDSLYSIDAALNYQVESFKISAVLKNLTNNRTYESLNYFGGRFVQSQPLSAYINFSLRY